MDTTLFLEEEPVNEQLKKEYEHQLLTMIIGGKNIEKKEYIIRHLNKDMFSELLHKRIFEGILKLKKEQKEIEVGNLCEILTIEEQKKFAISLEKEYITNMNCDYYLKKIQAIYIKRLLKECDSFEGYKKIEEIKRKYSVHSEIKHISESTDELIVEYYNKWGNSIKTYYPSIDNIIGSLQGGDVLILAGATAMGKTCTMLNLIMNMAEKKHKILLFSLEMQLKQLQNRIISAKTGVNSDKIRKFNMTNFEQKKYIDYALSEDFSKLNIEVCTIYDITTDKIKDIVLSSDCDIVYIDYLGLIKSNDNGNTYEKVSAISRDIKLIANETNKPFIVLHQLSRLKSDRKDKRPVLSDLRDSGKIEQDADFIFLVYRESYYNQSANKNKLELIIAKSRHSSGRKIIDLDYDAEKQLIQDKIGYYMESRKQGQLDV